MREIICGDRICKSLAWGYFNRKSHTYIIPLNSMTPREISMKENQEIFWKSLGCEEWVNPLDVGPLMWEKRPIDTRVIVDVIDIHERRRGLLTFNIDLYFLLVLFD